MTSDRLAQTVRQQLGLGRLLPLGGPHDGAWITEEAAESLLRRATDSVRGVRLGALRIALTDPDDVHEPAVPPPPSALPPGPLRLTGDFAATPSAPLPTTASRLRTALTAAARDRLGLTVTEVDLRVTALLDEDAEPEPVRPPEPKEASETRDGAEARAAEAALGVRGVTALTGTLGRAVHIEERRVDDTALPHRHVRLELAADADHQAVRVAREVRVAVSSALQDGPTVAVLVTAVV
ncbi:nucleopolyhedrovirus P10 family protein [Streptomyces blattellae]|uniref:nucleopolyhedrovirus P10 family protein n=1 Tax=Streptomyces blattellae TaxID=2569855 RepID=UPI0012B8664F|nr:nucleopolyhedrovirus P10 family protein [Streptomyces blattellae]